MDTSVDTFLPPLEKAPNPIMALAYAMSRRQFGKVLTPLKVHSARLPAAFGMFYGKIGQLDKKLKLPAETRMLVREHVARINQCLFCIDIGRYFTIQASMDRAKFDALEAYRTHPAFSDAERALLDYVGELTRDKHVDPETFRRMARQYSEREICEIVYIVATEHVYNITNIGLNIHADMLCDIRRRPDPPSWDIHEIPARRAHTRSMTLPTREHWTEEFIHALTRFLIAGRPASAVHPAHNGVTCGPYDVRIALPQPHHDDRLRIVVTYNRIAPPVEVAMPGTEIDAHLADEPEAAALRVMRWLLPRLTGQAA